MSPSHPHPVSDVRISNEDDEWHVTIIENGHEARRSFYVREYAYSFAAGYLSRRGLGGVFEAEGGEQ